MVLYMVQTAEIEQLTTTATPVSENLGMEMSLTVCPSDPKVKQIIK